MTDTGNLLYYGDNLAALRTARELTQKQAESVEEVYGWYERNR